MPQTENPYAALERIFHEPNRLAIMSQLSNSDRGVAFSDLKSECNLTDGNLSRHLRALEEAGAIRIDKRFVGVRPRTTVYLSQTGRTRFLEYLLALETVLLRAAEGFESEASDRLVGVLGRHAAV